MGQLVNLRLDRSRLTNNNRKGDVHVSFNQDNERLVLMYTMMGTLARLGCPVVFKGAMVLNNIITGLDINTNRMTKDIDADWVDSTVTNETLLNALATALSTIGNPNLYITQTREFASGRSAGFSIKDRITGIEIFTMDISVKYNNYYTTYYLPNGIQYTGQRPDKIYADKLYVLSTRKVYRRVKDMYDMYLLSHLTGYTLSGIRDILANTGKTLEDFEHFLTDKIQPKGLEYAYNSMTHITNKPDFKDIHEIVKDFIVPFISGTNIDATWVYNKDLKRGSWRTI